MPIGASIRPRAGHAPGASPAHRTEGKHSCGASNISFGCRTATASTRIPDHGDQRRHDSAITNPLHLDVVRACMAPTS